MSKILFIINGYPDQKSSANIFVKNQAQGLKKKGYDIGVMVIDLRSVRRFRKYGINKRLIDNIPVWFIAFPWGGYKSGLSQAVFNFFSRILFRCVVRDFGRPDILHAHFGSSGIAGALIKKLSGIPLVITEHSSLMLPNNANDNFKKRVLKAYTDCDKLIAVSSHLKNHIEHLGAKNVILIPNIIPHSYFADIGNVKKNAKQFISVGSLLHNKRFDLLLSAFERLCCFKEDATLLIAGNGPLFRELQERIHGKELQDRIILLGYVENSELPALYRESACFVLASDYETFGVVYAEAIASGIPVIASDCGGPADIIDQTNGLIIPRGDEDELYRALVYMYNNSSLYNSNDMINNCYEKFGEESVIRRISSVYKDLMNQN